MKFIRPTVTSKLLRAAGSVFHNRKGHRPGLAILIADVSTRQVQPQAVVATVGEGDDFDATEGVADPL
jgi:hypothetical protein